VLYPSESSSTAVTLPAAAEHEWRLSHQFADKPASRVLRVALGVSLVALMLVVVKIAW
jgi:hypothetical protein